MTRILAVLVLLLPIAAAAAPEADIWPRWLEDAPGSTRTVDQAPLADFLARYVRQGADGVNRVAYAAVTPADRAALFAHVDALQAVPVSDLARAQQAPYWINLYNALTVRTVLQHYPVESIRDIDISPGLFADGPWGAELVEVEGVPLSLDDIEHRILRPIWRDPRIHYAVNCAALGCPNLQPEPFTAERLDAQLDAAARAFVGQPRGVELADGRLRVSSIYRWFQPDFGPDEVAVIAHLREYAPPELARALAGFTRIDEYAYDWSLNDAGTRAAGNRRASDAWAPTPNRSAVAAGCPAGSSC